MVSVIGGGNGSCTEDVREHENHDTGGKALARRDFVTVDGVGFTVTAYSEWSNGTFCTAQNTTSTNNVLKENPFKTCIGFVLPQRLPYNRLPSGCSG